MEKLPTGVSGIGTIFDEATRHETATMPPTVVRSTATKLEIVMWSTPGWRATAIMIANCRGVTAPPNTSSKMRLWSWLVRRTR